MTFTRSFFFPLLIACLAVSAFGQWSTGSTLNQRPDAVISGAPSQSVDASSGLFFVNGERPRLNLSRPVVAHPIEPKSAALDDGLCYTMRMYKVKRTERVADNQSASRGYSTCELAKNYQFRSAVAHPRTAEESQTSAPQR